MYLNDIYTVSANLAGVPGICVPCGLSSEGLPIGLQLVGNFWSEGILLNLRTFTKRPFRCKAISENLRVKRRYVRRGSDRD